MGRQIHFYLFPEDQDAFLRYIQEHDPVVIVPRDSHSREIEPLSSSIEPDRTVCLWNRKFLQHLERQWIPDPGYYRIDGLKTAVLEFTPSFTGIWEGKPALGQGRLFGNFEPYLGRVVAYSLYHHKLERTCLRSGPNPQVVPKVRFSLQRRNPLMDRCAPV